MNTETQFTPGPWEITTGQHSETTEMYDKGETWFNVNSEDGVIADVLYGRCLGTDKEEAEANARLIAAAPDMYEFLEKVAIFHPDGNPITLIKEAQSLLNRLEP